MNLDEFNKNFPSFEKKYRKKQLEEQKIKKENDILIMKNKFNEIYKNIIFDNLQKQKNNYLTDD